MNVRSIFYGILCMLTVGSALTACSEDNNEVPNDNGSQVQLPQHRALILNEGSMGMNNSGIACYAPDGSIDFIPDLYELQNGKSLGDTGQDIIEYDDYLYVAVNGSNYLAKLNEACVEQSRVSFVDDPDLEAGIRYIDAEDGYIYASFYGGVVAKINANSLQVEQKLTGLGGNLEGVAIVNDYLYVANSYTQDGSNYTYHTEVLVIDLRTFQQTETLTVTQNPNKIVEVDDKVFLISWDYTQESYELQLIDPAQGNQVSRIGYATHVAGDDGVLYIIDSRIDYSNWPETAANNTYYTYNIATEETGLWYLTYDQADVLDTAVIYSLSIDDETGDIYIATTGHSNNNGDVYRFRADGRFVESFDCGGQNPNSIIFVD